MKREAFVKELLALAKNRGCQQAEVFEAWSEDFAVNVCDGEFDRYESAATDGLSLRVKVSGKDGYAFTQAFEEPEILVQKAMDNARAIESEDDHPMQVGGLAYETVTGQPSPFAALSEQERIALAVKMEAVAKAADPRVLRLMDCEVGVTKGGVAMENTLGLSVSREAGMSYCYAVPVIQEGEEVRIGFAFRRGREAMDVEACAREAVQVAVEKLGAKPVPSGEYAVILKNGAASALLSGFSGIFSAAAAQKGLSLLKDMEGQTVGSGTVTIWDDPFHPIAPRAFDGEGTPTKKKAVVEAGILKTLLHNLKTAKKAGVESTGNASRPSAASTVGVGTHVFYMEPGQERLEALQERMGSGLVITDLEGLHAGLNPISGDFSLKAEGYLVENGKKVRPVNEITVAGNFLKLLKAVEAVGSDLEFHQGSTAAPSLLISGLSVGGM